MSRRQCSVVVVVLSALSLACSGDKDSASSSGGDDQPGVDETFSEAVTKVVMEIDHDSGAEPYVGGYGPSSDIWELFDVNAAAVFGPDVTVTVPHTLDGMEDLGVLGSGPWDVDHILDLADAHRDEHSAGDTVTYYAVWLDGYYVVDGEEDRGVIGVSIGDTGVLAVFKPVLRNLSPIEASAAFSEQTTLIHEFGHAIGLVANGIPATSDHHDEAHGAHCTDNRCVMYWANEGSVELLQFASEVATSGETVIFKDACLADIAAVRD